MSPSKLRREIVRTLKRHGYQCLSCEPVKGHVHLEVAKDGASRKITTGGTPKNPNAAIDNLLKALRRYDWAGKKLPTRG